MMNGVNKIYILTPMGVITLVTIYLQTTWDFLLFALWPVSDILRLMIWFLFSFPDEWEKKLYFTFHFLKFGKLKYISNFNSRCGEEEKK